jgi:hypothetical protein
LLLERLVPDRVAESQLGDEGTLREAREIADPDQPLVARATWREHDVAFHGDPVDAGAVGPTCSASTRWKNSKRTPRTASTWYSGAKTARRHTAVPSPGARPTRAR